LNSNGGLRKIDAMSKTTNDYKDEDKSWRKENESYDKRLQSGTSTMYSHVGIVHESIDYNA